jgi:hypothetical protein
VDCLPPITNITLCPPYVVCDHIESHSTIPSYMTTHPQRAIYPAHLDSPSAEHDPVLLRGSSCARRIRHFANINPTKRDFFTILYGVITHLSGMGGNPSKLWGAPSASLAAASVAAVCTGAGAQPAAGAAPAEGWLAASAAMTPSSSGFSTATSWTPADMQSAWEHGHLQVSNTEQPRTLWC